MRKVPELIEALQATNCCDSHSLQLTNEVIRAIGGDFGEELDPSATAISPNLFVTLMYQNLLLARRIEQLEDRFDRGAEK